MVVIRRCWKRKKTALISASSIRMIDWKFVIMLLLERGKLGFIRSLLIKWDSSQPLYFTDIILDSFREKKQEKYVENTTVWLLPWWVIKERKQHVFRSLLLNDIIGEIITNFTLGKDAKQVALRFARFADLIWLDYNQASLFYHLNSAVTNLYIKIFSAMEKKLNKITTTTTTTTTSKLWYTSPNLVELKFIWLLKDTWYFHLSNDWMRQTVLHTLRKLCQSLTDTKSALWLVKKLLYICLYTHWKLNHLPFL